MDKQKLTDLLSEYDNIDVEKFVSYIYRLYKDQKTNYIIERTNEEDLASLYKRVDKEWLVFDWIHITLQSTGVSYDYVALKNKMLNVYPESVIDINIVYEWDLIEFSKKNWKIKYEHKIANPFWIQKDEDIIGAYTVIKNKRWEFLTTLNKDELIKHRRTAKTDFIRKARYKEMCLKTIMKKACKLHFGDIFTKIEEMDNENYNLEKEIIDENKVLDWFKKDE